MTFHASNPFAAAFSRRQALRLGALGLSLPAWLGLRDLAAAAPPRAGDNPGRGFGKAKSCIVLFAWGGMSHIDTFDLKPDAGSDVRSVFGSLPTRIPGYRVCEHLPRLARQVHRMTLIRSAHHNAPSHRSAAYWNLTGHAPPFLDANWPATRADWPCLGSLVALAKGHAAGALEGRRPALPGTVSLPYTMADGGRANGQDAGFLGLALDPVVVSPLAAVPYDGKSPSTGAVDLQFTEGLDPRRMTGRRSLLGSLEAPGAQPGALGGAETAQVRKYREQAMNMLLDDQVRAAFHVEDEPQALRDAYGPHVCGQSVLLARKLTEAGVPLATVHCAAGDLNGSVGAHWDTHGDGFNRLKGHLLPPLDQALSALLDDLTARGTLDRTLVVLMTEFGRTPKVNGSGGRDHYPNCYTVAFAGAGVSQGLLLGRSDKIGAFPASDPVTPADLHATIFHALGIDPRFTIHDAQLRPHAISDGRVLPVFG